MIKTLIVVSIIRIGSVSLRAWRRSDVIGFGDTLFPGKSLYIASPLGLETNWLSSIHNTHWEFHGTIWV